MKPNHTPATFDLFETLAEAFNPNNGRKLYQYGNELYETEPSEDPDQDEIDAEEESHGRDENDN